MTDDTVTKTNIIRRSDERVQCRSSGEIRLEGEPYLVQMLDVSSGGCKFRIAGLDNGTFPHPIPCEFEMILDGVGIAGAVIWFTAGMYGCRFYEHIMLDDVAAILAGGFRMRILPPLQNDAEDDDEPLSEAPPQAPTEDQ